MHYTHIVALPGDIKQETIDTERQPQLMHTRFR